MSMERGKSLEPCPAGAEELAEINPAYTVEDVQKATEAELKISPTLKPMCT